MSSTATTCPICKVSASFQPTGVSKPKSRSKWTCKRCGEFLMDGLPTEESLRNEPLANSGAASAWIRWHVVAEFGFKHIKAELCIGENFEFHATRDGKPFLIEIEAANGELAKVQRLR